MRLSWSLDRLQSTSVSAWGARRAFTVCGGLCTGNHFGTRRSLEGAAPHRIVCAEALAGLLDVDRTVFAGRAASRVCARAWTSGRGHGRQAGMEHCGASARGGGEGPIPAA